MSGDPMLSVRGLTKTFVLHTIDGRRVEGLRGVDLDVHAGEHVALAGSSGAGKSSLLKCIHRTYLPTSGSVRLRRPTGDVVDLTTIGDRELDQLRGSELGYVSQFLRAEPRRSTLDLVARAAVHRGMDQSTAREAAAVALARLGIGEDLWPIPATVLSGGEKQRVNLAAAVVEPPSVLLLDEPVSALDPRNRDAALQLVGELTDRGVAVLGVFHDLDAMRQLATRVALMDGGRIVADGPPDSILDQLAGAAR